MPRVSWEAKAGLGWISQRVKTSLIWTKLLFFISPGTSPKVGLVDPWTFYTEDMASIALGLGLGLGLP